MRGKSFLIKENIVEAIKYFRKAAIYNNNDYPLYIYKGLCEFLLKDLDSSLLSYQQALKLVDAHKTLTADEKSYLKIYIIESLLQIFNIQKDYSNYDLYVAIYKELTFDITSIRKYFLYDFPLEKGIGV